ncbi:MAG: hypothetical protein P4L80_18130 [Xanthobacteraceae bacterium]|nr:hypothetical protein [Xanthobacteraceae bacterium]
MFIGGTKAKSSGLLAAFAAAVVIGCGSAASAADMPIPAKAEPMYYAPPAACGSVYDFFFTKCPLTWYGVTFYGTVDMGVTYQTHGTPFDRNFPTGASYLLGGGGGNATNRTPGFGLGPNGLSQSNFGFKVLEPLGGGWSFVSQAGVAFDPYSLLLSNAPQSLQNGIGVPENQQQLPIDSSRWGWLADQIYAGVNSATFGTLTFGRQNTLDNDAIVAYDPMGASYAFSVIGFSGKTAGAGDTEDARWTTAIKYRVNIGDFRLSAMGQPGFGYGAYNPNQGAVAGGIGGDIRHLGPGTLSLDVIGTWEKDAVNIGTTFPGQATAGGWPTTFPGGVAAALGSGLKATISNQTSVMALAKYSFGGWTNPAPVVGKEPPAPSGPSGIPLTLYAGYEWIQFVNPSDPQRAFRDDGFLFNFVNAAGSHLSANGTTIANNAFNAACGSGTGCSNEAFQVMWTGAKYGITKDLDIIGAYYHYIQSTFVNGVNCSASAAAGNSRCQGWFDAYSLVLDWRFLPKWDAYIGTMYSAAFGGLANGDIARNNLATTAGVRFRF